MKKNKKLAETFCNNTIVSPGTISNPSCRNPSDLAGFKGGKKDSKVILAKLHKKLRALQELLYACGSRSVLVILQGMDASGKDGTISNVFRGVNPSGVRVVNFKAPTAEELKHDFLWRIDQQTPKAGQIVVFNRSHYEDVLIAKVRGLAKPEEIKRRYQAICQFEEKLVRKGTIILKFWLNIDREEQWVRLLDRVEDKSRHWKVSVSDFKETKYWDQYMDAAWTAIGKTSACLSPWFIIPSNKKWLRDLIIISLIVDVLEDLKMEVPQKLPESLKGNGKVSDLLKESLKLPRKARGGKKGMKLRSQIVSLLS